MCGACENASVGMHGGAAAPRGDLSGSGLRSAAHGPADPSEEARLPSCGPTERPAFTTLLCRAPPPPLSARYRAMKGLSRRRPRSSAARLPTVLPAADIAQQESSGKLSPAASSTGVVGRHSSVHTPSPHT